jgi:hypothetical protein
VTALQGSTLLGIHQNPRNQTLQVESVELGKTSQQIQSGTAQKRDKGRNMEDQNASCPLNELRWVYWTNRDHLNSENVRDQGDVVRFDSSLII